MSSRIAGILIAVLIASFGSFAAENASFTTAADGATVARTASGKVLWKRYGTESAASAHFAPSAPLPGQPHWDPPVTVSPVLQEKVGPVFDSLGNAWVVYSDSVNFLAVQSNGASGTWKTPHLIGPDDSTVMDTIGLAVDQAGGLYVTYNTSQNPDQPHTLMTVKYTPDSGWGSPVAVVNSPANFSETFPAIDSAGQLVIVYNPDLGVSSVVCKTATMSCGSAQAVAPRLAILPSVAANQSGSRVALVYLQTDANGAVTGLAYSFFDSATGTWPAPVLIPGAEKAWFDFYGVLNSFPMVVDPAGNVTLITETSPARGLYGVGGYRYEAGQWTVDAVLPPSRTVPDVGDFGSIALNDAGVVLAAVPSGAFSSDVSLYTFVYTPGKGWRTQRAALYNSDTVSRCRVAWLGTDQAAAVYALGNGQTDTFEEESAFYKRGIWTDGPPPIPGQGTLYPGFATAPTGDALLVMQARNPTVGFGTTASWLRK